MYVPGLCRGMPAAWVSWMIANDQLISDGMLVRHSCDNWLCENDWHLLIGTNRDNMIDMISRGRSALRKPTIPKSVRQEIRARWLDGVPTRQLVVDYDVSKAVIGKTVGLRYAEEKYSALWDVPTSQEG